MQWLSVNPTTARLASALVAQLRSEYISFLNVAKNDSVTVLSRRLPVQPTEGQASRLAAHSAGARLVYYGPRSERKIAPPAT